MLARAPNELPSQLWQAADVIGDGGCGGTESEFGSDSGVGGGNEAYGSRVDTVGVVSGGAHRAWEESGEPARRLEIFKRDRALREEGKPEEALGLYGSLIA